MNVVIKYLGLVLLGLCTTAFAANCPDGSNPGNGYVLAAATGSGTGANWTNAYTDLPATLTRGCTYWIGKGTYGRHTFNDTDSGTTAITIRAAIASNHGSAGDWNAGTMAGNATFRASVAHSTDIFEFDTDYYVLDGQTRSTATGIQYTDWSNASGYNITLSNVNGNLCSSSSGDNQGEHIGGGGHNVTIQYIEIIGNTPATDQCAAIGITLTSGAVAIHDWTMNYNLIHQIGARCWEFDGGGGANPGVYTYNLTVEYNFCYHNYTSSTDHGECMQIGTNTQTTTIAYNYIVDCVGTAYIATASGGSYNAGNNQNGPWYIYGNVFDADGSNCGVGDGHIYIFDAGFTGPVYIFNNTFSNLNASSCGTLASGVFFAGSGSHTEYFDGAYIYNNLNFNDDQLSPTLTCTVGTPPNGSAGCYTKTSTTYVWDYNSCFSMADTSCTSDTSTHVQRSASNPFVASSSHNWNLSADTSAGINTSSLVAANNTDLAGTTRGSNGTWDRGAFQIPGVSQATAPTFSAPSCPYTGLAPTVTIANSNTGTTVACYTTNGTTPVTNGLGTACTTGTQYTTSFIQSSTSTIKAVAGTSTLSDSSVTSCSITITPLASPGWFFSELDPADLPELPELKGRK